MSIESTINRVKKAIERRLDKCEKAAVMSELRTFVQGSDKFYPGRPVSISQAYREVLKDPRHFREVLDKASNGIPAINSGAFAPTS